MCGFMPKNACRSCNSEGVKASSHNYPSCDKACSELHLARLLGIIGLLFVVGFHLLVSPKLHVLIHIQRGLALVVYESVVNVKLLGCVWLKLGHLLNGYSVAVAATVQPELIDGLLIHTIRLAHLVIIELNTHKVSRRDQLELAPEVWNARRVQI